jgi:hypothetical protein
MALQSIDLDCAPGGVRPGDLIGFVVEGTGLELPAEPPRPIFGNATWYFEVTRERWEAEIQPVIKPRIVELYEQGAIRYGSW